MSESPLKRAHVTPRLRRKLRHFTFYGSIFTIIALIQISGLLRFIDNELTDTRFRFATRPATGQILLVEIDARSLAELTVWPWPRSHYAAALDSLFAAGAQRVALDIDFSSPSQPTQDQIFEEALRRYNNDVWLAVFQQSAITQSGRTYLHVNRPIEQFRRHTNLASINVRPAADGLIRRYEITSSIDSQHFFSIGTALAGNQPNNQKLFAIDYGIAPDTIPRISFIDILQGNFDPAEVDQRRIIIGATAVELGDRLAVPVWQNISGPMLNIIAAESILQERTLRGLSPSLEFLLAAVVILCLTPVFSRLSWSRGAAVLTVTAAGAFAASTLIQIYSPVFIDLALTLFALWLCYGFSLVSRINQQSLRIIIDGIASNRRRALLERVVEQSADGILILDGTGQTIVGNPSAVRMFGRDKIASGSSIHEYFAPATNKSDAVFLERLALSDPLAADGQAHEVIGLRPDDTAIELELLVSEVVTKDKSSHRQDLAAPERRMVCIVRDITERKRIDAMQRQTLEQSLQAARAKSDFFATMNHELRTPLNHIIGYADMLTAGYVGDLTEKQREYVSDIGASGKDLLHLVSEILEFANLERGEDVVLDEQEIPAHDFISGCIDSMLDRAADAQVSLTEPTRVHDQLILWIDHRAVQQALLNVLSNAIKFNQSNGEVRVDARETDTGTFSITVTDTGIGMTRSQSDYVLQPFSRVEDAMHRNEDGWGLGLPLAKALIEAHGGTLTIESELEKGTKITINLPADRIMSIPAKEKTARLGQQ